MLARWALCLFAAPLLSGGPVRAVSPENFYNGIPLTPDEQRELRRGSLTRMARGPTNLPWLPEAHSPNATSWNDTVALCTVIYNEELADVREWLHYYRWLGVDHVYLTDNESRDSKALRRSLAREFPPSFLTLRFHRRPAAQMNIVSWCVESLRARYGWIAFYDVDEFLLLRGGGGGPGALKPFLRGYKDHGGVVVHWIMMGPSGRVSRPAGGGALRWNTQCDPEPDVRIKTIVNTYFLRGVGNHPHNMDTGEVFVVNEAHEEVPPTWWALPRSMTAHLPQPPYEAMECNHAGRWPRPPDNLTDYCYLRLRGASVHPEPRAERAALLHYAAKSEADFKAKQARGGGMAGRKKTQEYFDDLVRRQKDAPICRELENVAEECCPLSPPPPRPHKHRAAGVPTSASAARSGGGVAERAFVAESGAAGPEMPARVLLAGVVGASVAVLCGLLLVRARSRPAR